MLAHTKPSTIIQIHPVSHQMATTFKTSTPEGSSPTLHERTAQGAVFWKACTRCEYEGLCNSRQYWQWMAKKSFKIDLRPNHHKLKTMVRRHKDEINRTRNFKVRKERVETVVLIKTQKRKNVGKGTVFRKEMLAVSATTTVSVERKHNQARHTMTEDDLRKEVPPEAVVLQEGNIKERAEITSKENTNPSCDYWHPAVCQNYISESGCKFGEKCVFRHTEVDKSAQQKSRNRMVEKVLLPH